LLRCPESYSGLRGTSQALWNCQDGSSSLRPRFPCLYSSCATTATQPEADTATPAPAAQRAPLRSAQTASDEELGLEIRRRLSMLGPALTLRVMVVVEDGLVSLRGSAPDAAAS